MVEHGDADACGEPEEAAKQQQEGRKRKQSEQPQGEVWCGSRVARPCQGVAHLQHVVPQPLLGEWQLEKLPPEHGGDQAALSPTSATNICSAAPNCTAPALPSPLVDGTTQIGSDRHGLNCLFKQVKDIKKMFDMLAQLLKDLQIVHCFECNKNKK
ncbi:hypothetical protein ZWY2020_006552 [Hordeum vulgare]|nr:hypothetical protein ZWY2020_006552 [Hordeum vulgare]